MVYPEARTRCEALQAYDVHRSIPTARNEHSVMYAQILAS